MNPMVLHALQIRLINVYNLNLLLYTDNYTYCWKFQVDKGLRM